MKQGRLAHQLVNMMAENRAGDFCEIAEDLQSDAESRALVMSELLNIVNRRSDGVVLRQQQIAVDVLGILGFAKSSDVRRELFCVLEERFSEEKLVSLATLEAQSRNRTSKIRNLELEFLMSLIRAVLRIPEEPYLRAVQRIAKVFAGTRFAMRIDRLIRDVQGEDS